jgi:asparagine synthase (glutamine-hydrolysing)
VGLGHARLSIIDLATGDQPIVSENGRTRVVVNGEFYGYEAIQRELEDLGHRLRTKSDSEIVLHLYEDLGTESLHRLRGEFAFVVWDETNRTMFAARDRFGIKPLFYAFHNDTLYLASEVKALFAAGVPAGWDVESIYHSVELGATRYARFLTAYFKFHRGTTSLPRISIFNSTDTGTSITQEPMDTFRNVRMPSMPASSGRFWKKPSAFG